MRRPNGQCRADKYQVIYPDGSFSGCGRWLDAKDFEDHRVQREDVDGYARRCLTDAELLERGWTDFGDGHWASPRRVADAQRANERRLAGDLS